MIDGVKLFYTDSAFLYIWTCRLLICCANGGMNTIIDLSALEIEEGSQSEYSPRSSQQSETPSSRASTSDSEGVNINDLNNNTQWRTGFFRLLKKGSQMPFQTFHPLKNVPKLTRRKSKRIREDLIPSLNSPALQSSFDAEFCCFKSSWKNFTLSEIQAATNDFSHGMKFFSLKTKLLLCKKTTSLSNSTFCTSLCKSGRNTFFLR